jgi:hypothetical protein
VLIAASAVVNFGRHQRHVHLRFELADDVGRRFAGRRQADHICPSMA